jgi:hypothetical protein
MEPWSPSLNRSYPTPRTQVESGRIESAPSIEAMAHKVSASDQALLNKLDRIMARYERAKAK